MGLVNTLGSFVHETSYDDLPHAVINSTKERLLDFLGGVLSEYKHNIHKPIFEVLRTYGGNKESTVIGRNVKLPRGFAALINSSMSSEMGDGSRFAGLHPGPVVIPAALAMSEAKTTVISGKDLILAIALGYEVMIRVGRAMNPSAVKRGFFLTGIAGPLGSAAAAGKIINLDEASMINSLSIAAISGSGLLEAFKAPHPFVLISIARACEAGIICALLAQNGVKGNDTILEEGFIPAFSDDYDLDLITRDLGRDYMIPKTYIKMYGGCRHIHAPIDAVLYIVKEHNIGLEEIEKIRVKTYSVALDLTIETPKSGDDAMFNIPFGISAGLIYGNVFSDKFTERNLRSKQIQELMRRVTVEHNPELDTEYPEKRGTMVEIITKDGGTFSHKLDFARGEPECPFSKSEIEDKFEYLVSKAIDAETRQKLIYFVNKLETVEEISSLFALLKAKEN